MEINIKKVEKIKAPAYFKSDGEYFKVLDDRRVLRITSEGTESIHIWVTNPDIYYSSIEEISEVEFKVQLDIVLGILKERCK